MSFTNVFIATSPYTGLAEGRSHSETAMANRSALTKSMCKGMWQCMEPCFLIVYSNCYTLLPGPEHVMKIPKKPSLKNLLCTKNWFI